MKMVEIEGDKMIELMKRNMNEKKKGIMEDIKVEEEENKKNEIKLEGILLKKKDKKNLEIRLKIMIIVEIRRRRWIGWIKGRRMSFERRRIFRNRWNI